MLNKLQLQIKDQTSPHVLAGLLRAVLCDCYLFLITIQE